MPYKPTVKDLKLKSIDILNTIRNEASSTYQERIPVATQNNIRDVGNAMMRYQTTQNEFLSALVNRIARVIITSKSYTNPLRRFKKGILEYGESIEEVFVNIAKAHQYDPAVAENEVFKREIPDVLAAFHKMNYQNFYKVTISNEQLRQAFLSAEGITDLISRIVDTLYSGSEFDEFLIMKQLIVDAANDGKFFPVSIPAITAENAKEIVTKIKSVSNQLEFMSAQYNEMGVLTYTRKPDQILIMDAAFDAVIDVEVLASAFNMEKAEFMGQRVLIDNFGTLTGVVAALVDADWFMVYDNFIGFTENYNGEGLYWNYWYHVWKTFSNSPFANAVLFTTQTTEVTGVTVVPNTATVTAGHTIQLTASVAGTGYVPKDVTWTMTGNLSQNSKVSSTGVVTIGADETAASVVVTATSVYDASKSGSSTITVA